MKHAAAIGPAYSTPNSSIPISVQASGVLLAPANTATKPRAANNPGGAPISPAKAFPSAAPMKNKGVTSPPLKPELTVTAVKTSFQAQLHG